ncbi:MAG TPA: hypothetical protein VK907_07645, partial [Phnomibacter sp.]|nr:hypothetical protein [Phnomibacter sp.]
AAEKAAKDKAEADRLAAEKENAAKAEAERLSAERRKAEDAAAEKLRLEREAAEKAAAEKAAAEKAEADRIAAAKAEADRIAAEKKKADEAAAEKARLDREAAEKARTQMVDNVEVKEPSTPSSFKIAPNEKQVVVVVLEKIDLGYVNEVSYTLLNTNLRKRNENEVINVVKKKVRDDLWLVELHSPSFTNMQEAYNYIKYLKPNLRDDLITWLDESKYFFVTISQDNLAEVEKKGDIQLYYKVLREAVPGKF